MDFLDGATTSLDIAIYGFSDGFQGVAQPLTGTAAAVQRAIARLGPGKVRIVTDLDVAGVTGSAQFDLLDTLDGNQNGALDPAVVKGRNTGSAETHNKFVVRDDRFVLTGSANWTPNGFNQQENNILVIDAPGAVTGGAAIYKKQFEQMFVSNRYTNSTPLTDPSSFVTADGIAADVRFAPQDDLTSRIVAAISSATASVYFGINAFSISGSPETNPTPPDLIGNALVAAGARGVQVRGVMDDDGGQTQWARLFGKPNIDVVNYIGGINALHSKFMIVDWGTPGATVLTGSNNWTAGADNTNNENLIVLASSEVANAYFDNFREMYVRRSTLDPLTVPFREYGDLTGDGLVDGADVSRARDVASGVTAASDLVSRTRN